ncbi:MAG: hypothetical protein ACKO9I_11225 [Sphaerospermopsis kisseleviana]
MRWVLDWNRYTILTGKSAIGKVWEKSFMGGVRSGRGEAFGRLIINFCPSLFSECFARTGVRRKINISCFPNHQFPVPYHQSPITSSQFPI